MLGEPAANHAENTTVIRGARIKSSLDLGGWGGGWQAGDLYWGTWVNKRRGFSSAPETPGLGTSVPHLLSAAGGLQPVSRRPLWAVPAQTQRTAFGLMGRSHLKMFATSESSWA